MLVSLFRVLACSRRQSGTSGRGTPIGEGRLRAVLAQLRTCTRYHNAKAESFFKTLKREEVYLKEYRAFSEAEANIGQFIEDVYNAERLHSSPGNLPPAEFEALHYRTAKTVT